MVRVGAAAHADICSVQGSWVGWLGKKGADEVVGGRADNCSVKGVGVVWLGKKDANEVVGGRADNCSVKGAGVGCETSGDATELSAAAPIRACCRVPVGFGLGKGNYVGVGGIGGAADSGVAGGMGRRLVRALSPRFSQGSKSRDMAGCWAKVGGQRYDCVCSWRVNDSLGVCHR